MVMLYTNLVLACGVARLVAGCPRGRWGGRKSLSSFSVCALVRCAQLYDSRWIHHETHATIMCFVTLAVNHTLPQWCSDGFGGVLVNGSVAMTRVGVIIRAYRGGHAAGLSFAPLHGRCHGGAVVAGDGLSVLSGPSQHDTLTRRTIKRLWRLDRLGRLGLCTALPYLPSVYPALDQEVPAQMLALLVQHDNTSTGIQLRSNCRLPYVAWLHAAEMLSLQYTQYH